MRWRFIVHPTWTLKRDVGLTMRTCYTCLPPLRPHLKFYSRETLRDRTTSLKRKIRGTARCTLGEWVQRCLFSADIVQTATNHRLGVTKSSMPHKSCHEQVLFDAI